MPELPEVEILVRHLDRILKNKTIASVEVRRPKVLRPTTSAEFSRRLTGTRFVNVTRRGKYLLFGLRGPVGVSGRILLGHLGMTGRIYVVSARAPLPRHAAVVLHLSKGKCVFEDTRYFGRMTFDLSPLERLGPEPLEPDWTADAFFTCLSNSKQPIKIKLLDQSVVAGVGNIYASEALFRARISPVLPANRLSHGQASQLFDAIRETLIEAIDAGSTVPLDFTGSRGKDRLFYYGSAEPGNYVERLQVYDRAGQPCVSCGSPIQRIIQATRSTYYCRTCQPKKIRRKAESV